MSDARNVIAELAIDARKLMLHHATTAVPDAVVQTRFHPAIDHEVPYLFYAVRTTRMDAFDEALRADPSTADPMLISESSVGEAGERLYRVCPTPETMFVPEVTRLGGAMFDGTCRDGTWTAKFQLPDTDVLAELRSFCLARDIGFELRRLYHADASTGWDDDGLTDAQREALLAAFEDGYFAEPRTASLADLADRLGISSTAVGGRLRRGTARLVEHALVDDRRD